MFKLEKNWLLEVFQTKKKNREKNDMNMNV